MAFTKIELLPEMLSHIILEVLVLVIYLLTVLLPLLLKLQLPSEELFAPDYLHDLVDAESSFSSCHSLQLDHFSDAVSVFHHFNISCNSKLDQCFWHGAQANLNNQKQIEEYHTSMDRFELTRPILLFHQLQLLFE